MHEENVSCPFRMVPDFGYARLRSPLVLGRATCTSRGTADVVREETKASSPQRQEQRWASLGMEELVSTKHIWHTFESPRWMQQWWARVRSGPQSMTQTPGVRYINQDELQRRHDTNSTPGTYNVTGVARRVLTGVSLTFNGIHCVLGSKLPILRSFKKR